MCKCDNCKFIQYLGKRKECLTCKYFDESSFGKYTDCDSIIDLLETLVTDKDNISSVNESKNIQSISFRDSIDKLKDKGIDIKETFGIDIEENDEQNNIKQWYYFVIHEPKYNGKYFKKYGTRKQIMEYIDSFNASSVTVYTQEEWITPNKYTKRKPCDCYELWM